MRAEERTRRKALPVPRHATLLDLSALLLFALLHLVRRLEGEGRERKSENYYADECCAMHQRKAIEKNAEKSEDKNN
jgi:hypothetical protein